VVNSSGSARKEFSVEISKQTSSGKGSLWRKESAQAVGMCEETKGILLYNKQGEEGQVD